MNEVLDTLRNEFPGLTITGGDRSEGFWISVDAPTWGWSWERNRMSSTEAILEEARKAIYLRMSRG